MEIFYKFVYNIDPYQYFNTWVIWLEEITFKIVILHLDGRPR